MKMTLMLVNIKEERLEIEKEEHSWSSCKQGRGVKLFQDFLDGVLN